MTRRTAREMAQDRLATAKRKREAVEARIVRAGAFGVPPMSVLDCRMGDWQDRKRRWSLTRSGTS